MVGGICRESKEIFLEIVGRRTRENFHDLILESVNWGTTMMTDCWRSYDTLEDYGYVHKKVNHSVSFLNPEDREIHTQTIENLWGKIKPFLRSKGTNKKTLISYIREYEFKRCSTNVFESILLALKAE